MAGTPARWHSACRKRRPFLAPGGELRPDGGDRVVECDQPGVDQLQGEQRHERLADRVEVDQRVVPPRRARRRIGPTADQVDHGHPVDDDAHRGADFAALGEVPGELARARRRSGRHSGPRPGRPRVDLSSGVPPAVDNRTRLSLPGRAPARPVRSLQEGCPTRQVAHHQTLDLPAVVGPAQRHGVGRPRPREEGSRLLLGHGATLATQRHHAVVGEHPAVPGLGRHEIPLGRHVQAHRPGHPLPQRPSHRTRGVGGVRLVGAPGQQMADVVHQSRGRQLVVAGMEVGQQRRRLQGVVELR